jgi:hypothetical protein
MEAQAVRGAAGPARRSSLSPELFAFVNMAVKARRRIHRRPAKPVSI